MNSTGQNSSFKVVHRNSYSQVPDKLRVAIMGESRVGKSSLLSRLLYNEYSDKRCETVQEIHHPCWTSTKGHQIDLDIMDIGGSKPLLKRGAISYGDAFVLVFALDDHASFAALSKLRQDIFYYKTTRVPLIVVATKSDLGPRQRRVSSLSARSVSANDWDTSFVETSAKDNVNVPDILEELFKQYNRPKHVVKPYCLAGFCSPKLALARLFRKSFNPE